MKLYGKHTEAVAQRIVEAFEHPENLPQALAPIFIRKDDDSPSRKWSWHNQLLAALAGTADARGMKQWNKVGRKVKKGSSAIWILAPCIRKLAVESEDGDPVERTIIYGFRSVPVFAVEDTEGEPLSESHAQYDQWVKELPLLEVAEAWGIDVSTYNHNPSNPLGFYRHSGNGNKSVMLGVENLSTWCHELIHAADHQLFELRGPKTQLEIVAELGGAVLLQCLGKEYDADLGGAYAYIKRFAEDEGKSTVQGCIAVLDRVCRCVQHVLETAEQLQLSESSV